MKLRHRLISIDVENRTGVCSVCGAVEIVLRDSKLNYWRCGVENRQRDTKYSTKFGYFRMERLKLSHVFSINDFEKLLDDQKGVCAICGKKHKKRLSVDHDHKTGKVRGLLCAKCNLALGYFYDNINNLKSAIRYLQK